MALFPLVKILSSRVFRTIILCGFARVFDVLTETLAIFVDSTYFRIDVYPNGYKMEVERETSHEHEHSNQQRQANQHARQSDQHFRQKPGGWQVLPR